MPVPEEKSFSVVLLFWLAVTDGHWNSSVERQLQLSSWARELGGEGNSGEESGREQGEQRPFL